MTVQWSDRPQRSTPREESHWFPALTQQELDNRAPFAVAPPRMGAGLELYEDGRGLTPEEARFVAAVLAVATVVFGALTVATWLWANGRIVWP